MAKKRATPTEKEAARVAAPAPAPARSDAKVANLDEAKAALAMARSPSDIAAVLYGLAPAERGALHDEVVAARNRVLGVS